MENAKKNLVFHFGVGRHASFPKKPVVKDYTEDENVNAGRDPLSGLLNSEYAA